MNACIAVDQLRDIHICRNTRWQIGINRLPVLTGGLFSDKYTFFMHAANSETGFKI
jgi:hypothetical protein